MRDDMAALNQTVDNLKHAVRRIARTSTDDVGRRAARGAAVDMNGRIMLAGGAASDVRVINVSDGGAAWCDGPDLTVGARRFEVAVDGHAAAVRCAEQGRRGFAWPLRTGRCGNGAIPADAI
jgi:hypothetical protein